MYAYCSSGSSESTQDLVFCGHSIIAENGEMLCENSALADTGYMLVQDGDVATNGTSAEDAAIRSYLEGGFYYE